MKKLSTAQLLQLSVIGLVILIFTLILFDYVAFFSGLNDLLLDQFILSSSHRQPHKNVIIVVIDDECAATLGSPLPREHIVEVIRKLNSYGAKTITFDLIFQDEKDHAIDLQLATICDSVNHVVHSFAFTETPESEYLEKEDYQQYAIDIKNREHINPIYVDQATFPNIVFKNSFHHAGFFNIKRDTDGQIRRIPLFINFEDLDYPALALTTIYDYYEVPQQSISIEKNFWGRNAVIETAEGNIAAGGEKCCIIPIRVNRSIPVLGKAAPQMHIGNHRPAEGYLKARGDILQT